MAKLLEKQEVTSKLNADHMILVVSSSLARGENLRGLIEFMDTPNVRTTMPANWRAELGSARLDALFLAEDLSATDIDLLLGEVGKMDANVPIVLLDAEAGV
jgi:hypothetical protein